MDDDKLQALSTTLNASIDQGGAHSDEEIGQELDEIELELILEGLRSERLPLDNAFRKQLDVKVEQVISRAARSRT